MMSQEFTLRAMYRFPAAQFLGKVTGQTLSTVTQEEWARAPRGNIVTDDQTLVEFMSRVERRAGNPIPGLIRHALRSRNKEVREAAIRWIGQSHREPPSSFWIGDTSQ